MNEPSSEQIPAVVSKITVDVAKRLRTRVLEEKSKNQDLSYAIIGDLISREFPEFKGRTLKAYAVSVGEITDKVFGLYVDGKISWSVLNELGQSRLDKATVEFLASEFINRRMEIKALRMVKSMLRDSKHRYSMAEALARATGQIPAHAKPKTLGKVLEDFETQLDRLSKKMMEVRALSTMVVDLLPVSAFDKGRVRTEIFEKVYLARHIFKEHFEFCDKRSQEILGQIMQFVSSESQMAELRRKGEDHVEGTGSGTADQGAEDQLPEAGEVLEDPAPHHRGEGRIEEEADPGAPDRP